MDIKPISLSSPSHANFINDWPNIIKLYCIYHKRKKNIEFKNFSLNIIIEIEIIIPIRHNIYNKFSIEYEFRLNNHPIVG